MQVQGYTRGATPAQGDRHTSQWHVHAMLRTTMLECVHTPVTCAPAITQTQLLR